MSVAERGSAMLIAFARANMARARGADQLAHLQRAHMCYHSDWHCELNGASKRFLSDGRAPRKQAAQRLCQASLDRPRQQRVLP